MPTYACAHVDKIHVLYFKTTCPILSCAANAAAASFLRGGGAWRRLAAARPPTCDMSANPTSWREKKKALVPYAATPDMPGHPCRNQGRNEDEFLHDTLNNSEQSGGALPPPRCVHACAYFGGFFLRSPQRMAAEEETARSDPGWPTVRRGEMSARAADGQDSALPHSPFSTSPNRWTTDGRTEVKAGSPDGPETEGGREGECVY